MNETGLWLWLTMVFGIGSRRIWELMNFFGTVTDACNALLSEDPFFRLNDKEKENVSNIPLSSAEKLIASCNGNGISVVGYSSPDYPGLLRYIKNPPAVLYYKGDISCVSGNRTVTSVGARRASEYSLRNTGRICGELSRAGYVIVSGFALGIDIVSHMSAAEQGRPTAAVMGCGVDVDYPRENVRYRSAILENGGVFISEYPPGTPPHSGNFPKRNRILAALGMVCVVFEASSKSGSLITANLAADHGREVFVIPPADIFDDRYSGNTLLLRDGAVPLFSSEDITERFRLGNALDKELRSSVIRGISPFNAEIPVKKERSSVLESLMTEAPVRSRKKSVKAAAVPEKLPEKPPVTPDPDLTDVQRAILDILSVGKIHADMIAERMKMEPDQLMVELTELEILGRIRSLPGKMFEIS